MRRLFRVKRLQHEAEVPITDHLEELRDRLIICIAVLGVALIVAFWRRGDLLDLMNRPLPDSVSGGKPITLSPGEPLKLGLLVSFWGAVLVTFPVLFYQMYAFIVPAFEDRTQKAARPLIYGVPLLFLVGVAFSYILVVPAAMRFLLSFDADKYNIQVQAGSFYTSEIMIMLALGVVFELPAMAWVLAKVGAISARFMRKNRRYAIFIMAVVAAALPGGDPISMMLALIPLLVLYELSILIVAAVEKARHAEAIGEPLSEA